MAEFSPTHLVKWRKRATTCNFPCCLNILISHSLCKKYSCATTNYKTLPCGWWNNDDGYMWDHPSANHISLKVVQWGAIPEFLFMWWVEGDPFGRKLCAKKILRKRTNFIYWITRDWLHFSYLGKRTNPK